MAVGLHHEINVARRHSRRVISIRYTAPFELVETRSERVEVKREGVPVSQLATDGVEGLFRRLAGQGAVTAVETLDICRLAGILRDRAPDDLGKKPMQFGQTEACLGDGALLAGPGIVELLEGALPLPRGRGRGILTADLSPSERQMAAGPWLDDLRIPISGGIDEEEGPLTP